MLRNNAGAGRTRANSWDPLSCLRFLVPSENRDSGTDFLFLALKDRGVLALHLLALEESLS